MSIAQTNFWYSKKVAACIASTAMMLSMAVSSLAADFVSIQIYPEHVGVFTTVGKQQFVAYGIDQNFGRVNITERVDWTISKDKEGKEIATIDETGMATIFADVTSGQVKVTCSYPKAGKGSPGVNLLLLQTPGQGAR